MNRRNPVTRREMLRASGKALLALPVLALPSCTSSSSSSSASLSHALWSVLWRTKPFHEPQRIAYPESDDQLLDDIERAAFAFFWDEASSTTGQVKDRALLNGNDKQRIASIAATGYGLTGLCIGDSRGYGKSAEIRERVRQTLRFAKNKLPNEHGFFYHFIDMETGERAWNCELSSMDTSLFLCGILTARQHFQDAEIQDLATAIYERVDWQWMLDGGKTLSMGWKPESGFLDSRWNQYCELMMIYLLGLGSPTHAIPNQTWNSWSRPKVKYEELEYISGGDPLFTHQFSQAWFDFRQKRDAYADYFTNSTIATEAHKRFCLSLRDEFPDYSGHLWGISSSDSQTGYQAWGGPPRLGRLDGSVVPYAAGGSLPFLRDDCMMVLRNIRERYPKAWGKYGFVDAFNPLDGWYNADVIGIDVGITLLMAENARSGFVWETFMKNKEMQTAMDKAGFQKEHV